MSGVIKRPILRYHGGKFLLAKWIISHFPKHRIYCEPFGGAASVLLQKERAYSEVYNDLDIEVVNLFKVCRERGQELITNLSNTPFARKEFELSYIKTDDEIEQARRTVIRSFMGFGSASASGRKTGFRSNSNRSGTTPAHDWKNFPEALSGIIERLQGVVIENRDAFEIIRQHDTSETLFYLDPPYTLDSRCNGQKTKSYRYEMKDEQHIELCKMLNQLKGVCIVSGYDNSIYNDLLKDWSKVKKSWFSDGAKKRVEVLWLSPNYPQHSQMKLM